MKRRTFLKTTAAAVPMIVSATTLGRGGPPPSDRVRIGLIGLGGRCRVLAREALTIPELEIAAVCDLFKPQVDSMMVEMGIEHSWTPYMDLHRMLDRERLDGVVVATTTHARAWTTCHAMAAGWDVFIEKPMSLTIGEGQQMLAAARKHRRVTQVPYRDFYLGRACEQGEVCGGERGQAGNGGRLAGREGVEAPAIACLARIPGSAESGQDACKRLSARRSEVLGTVRARLCLTGGRMDTIGTSGDAVTKGKGRRAGEGHGAQRDPGHCSVHFGGGGGCDR